ncbi:hypothetical protein [Phytohabitans houttuyneae]|uniref:Uncharacterized protein n=1 Tax=Phytohabitans houttuyneae TaxID=1076126 RepID=A0A6V8KU40_9ACTN|nr:hypothetical protein [Phytohabitans houttuyneae]GFJ85851.1 hypothetical protein Phou_100310 [Phytohabitans houttuyneae]
MRRTSRAALPPSVEPMFATTVDAALHAPGWLFEAECDPWPALMILQTKGACPQLGAARHRTIYFSDVAQTGGTLPLVSESALLPALRSPLLSVNPLMWQEVPDAGRTVVLAGACRYVRIPLFLPSVLPCRDRRLELSSRHRLSDSAPAASGV